jgi:hypothetical protein
MKHMHTFESFLNENTPEQQAQIVKKGVAEQLANLENHLKQLEARLKRSKNPETIDVLEGEIEYAKDLITTLKDMQKVYK